MARPEALRLLRIARRDLRMARRLLDPEVEEASWGWAAQQCLEKTLKAWLHHLGNTPPSTHDISRLLLLLQEAGIEIKPLLPLRAFTSFAVQYRYDDEPEELSLDRTAWCATAQALIEQVEGLLG
ncbi:HEPN domain-containing protein [Synechococcus sp. J7-Johnson]|uniref:HEPN domain-containing protein n=1 Tax=Synechococcus sp. J7-Johnson TaxID=2823737 RepID=UPI0020CBFE1F|nr:HEPN domain-containing protein [Synechococcus sp. J7-Johnson]MCP9840691.1 HEPN domain-containing protein [Synechococcus sp. J7-Johnson]